MRASAEPVGATTLTTFDVCIIGSGAGGSAAAHVLTRHGLKVLVLECGPNRFKNLGGPGQPVPVFSNDEQKTSHRPLVGGDSRVEPQTWRTDTTEARSYVGNIDSLPRTVGGGAVYADLKTPRFLPQDFHLGTELAASMTDCAWADWPVDYDMLEPFYGWVERLVGVQGLAGSNPFDGKRSSPYPMAPGVPMYGALKLVEGAKKLGLNPHPFPGAVNSRPYDGRPACADCGFCTGYGCPSNAKGAPPVTLLRKALLSGKCLLLPEHKVKRLVTDGAKKKIVSVEAIDSNGAVKTFTAERFVLAANAVESARLLFLSGEGGDALGNSSGQVGRNLTFHFQTNVAGVFDERLHSDRGRTITHGFTDFRGVPKDPLRPLGGIVEISGGPQPISEASFYRQILGLFRGYSGAAMKKLMKQSPGRVHLVALAMQAEDAPQSKNRVDLDPAVKDFDGLPVARVTYKNHAFELSASDFYRPKLMDLVLASGGRYAIPAPAAERPESAHVHGTLRFGNDPKTSVCNAEGKLHDLENLYAVDGSLFPTGSGFNPTLTIMALAARVASGMVFAAMPEKAIDP